MGSSLFKQIVPNNNLNLNTKTEKAQGRIKGKEESEKSNFVRRSNGRSHDKRERGRPLLSS